MTVLEMYNIVAIASALILVHLAFKTGHDKACTDDAKWLQIVRKAAYLVLALAALYTVDERMSPLSMLILVGTALGLLAVTELVLHFRQPPKPRRSAGAVKSEPTTGMQQPAMMMSARARAKRPF